MSRCSGESPTWQSPPPSPYVVDVVSVATVVSVVIVVIVVGIVDAEVLIRLRETIT